MIIGSSNRCWAIVDLAALERNVGKIRAALPKDIRYIAVVKADAYGHGLPQVVPRLMHSLVHSFAVANVQEAATIRELGLGWPILILSSLLPEEDRYLADYNLTATISSHDEVERFNQVGQKHNEVIPVQIKVDTGMGRLGVWYENAPALFEAVHEAPFLSLTGIYTHFPSADSDLSFTHEQRKRFQSLLQSLPLHQYPDLIIHADNSAGLETFSSAPYINAVRLGLVQFGVVPQDHPFLQSLQTEPVLSLKSRVGLVKTLPKGATLSYGRTHTLSHDAKIAIVTAGYGDGVDIGLSNKGQVLIHGQRFSIVGRVTMDQTLVDITNGPPIQVGDEVTLIGQEGADRINISEWSQWADTIEWDIYCSITKRVPRKYLNNVFS